MQPDKTYRLSDVATARLETDHIHHEPALLVIRVRTAIVALNPQERAALKAIL